MHNAIINLNHPAHYIGLGPFSISLGNLLIIVAMCIVFLAALFIPFPHSHNEGEEKK